MNFGYIEEMKVFYYFLLLSLGWSYVNAQQFPSKVFHRGEVLMFDGTLKKGSIKYDLESDVILLQDSVNQGIETISAINLKAFRLLPSENKPTRLFYVLPFRNESGYSRPKIFEVLLEDRYSLVAREYIVVRSRPVNGSFVRMSQFDPFFSPMNDMYRQEYLTYNLYLVSPEGELTNIGSKKREVLSAFGRYNDKLKSYIKTENLNMGSLDDIVKLVKYYNELFAL